MTHTGAHRVILRSDESVAVGMLHQVLHRIRSRGALIASDLLPPSNMYPISARTIFKEMKWLVPEVRHLQMQTRSAGFLLHPLATAKTQGAQTRSSWMLLESQY